MKKLNIDFENCFGIGKLSHEFKFQDLQSNTFLIYAPNGTMKTSFARTFDVVSKNEPKKFPCDRIYTDKKSKYEILVDDSSINPDNILVLNAEDNSFDASNKVSSFLASKELKKQYDEIYSELNNQKSEYLKKLKTVSQSTDCESELINSFSENSTYNLFEVLLKERENLKPKFDKYSFKYNDVFDKKSNVKKFLEKSQPILDQYITDYKKLLSESSFFKQTGNNSFGTYQANEILKSIEDNSFFEAGHKFVLEDGTEINNSEVLKAIVEAEIDKIINDSKLKQSFDKIDKAIGANTELRSFKKVIEKDNLILVELKDYENFQKKVWISYLSQIKDESEELAEYYKLRKVQLEQIIIEAKKEFLLWKSIIKTFNSRFYVPFEVILTNHEDIILKQETASLEFDYVIKNEAPVRQKKDILLSVLSKGEQRAYFILQFLFEIESRKANAENNIIIFDDIADSFDYKNKFAIIEYIKDLHLSNTFRMIILTHNFDFYRTIASRLSLSTPVVYMATKSENRTIKLHNGQYRNDVFTYFIRNYDKPKIFISLIAFVRNIIEYTESNSCDDYLTLTNCLHIKTNSQALLVKDIFDIYKSRMIKLTGKSIDYGNENLLGFIISTANSISAEQNINEVHLENKICLAIAIRLKAEEYLIKKLPHLNFEEITSNQTSVLFAQYKAENPTSAAIELLDRVNLMTPENIHINAFMFEPLIDMSVYHLKDLYQNISILN
ncbi:MAG: hypothetical protein ABIP27_09555 [Flavobacterium circumlabens]|uniref:hypothetical protein n=1 Tax=Flavobacterium circumlabens TaxID=2133765 RepID=UPI003264D7B6